MTISVFDYLDHHKFLKDYFEEKKAHCPFFSYKYFAQKAGFSSPNFLKLVIDGKRNLTKDSVFKFCKAMGLNKKDTAERFGEKLVHSWRRSYTTAPPNGESLHQAGMRILKFFYARILCDVQRGLNTLVVAHGNTLRVIVKELDHLSDEEIMDVNIATGEVVVYEYDMLTKIVGKKYL